MQIKNNNELNFIIYCFFSFDKDITGGNIVRHKLAYELARRGCNVYMFTSPEYPHENIEVIHANVGEINENTSHTWEGFIYPVDKTISIYPQMVYGNPFNTKHVCRWIMYHTRREIEESFELEDVYFNFGDFKTFKKQSTKSLTVFDYKLEKLYNKNLPNRRGFCHIIHKNHPENFQEIFDFFKSENLEDFKKSKRFDFDYLRENFNKYEYFLTFDKKSFFTTAAALCGCKSIILNPESTTEFYENAYTDYRKKNSSITPFEYRLKNPIQMFGVAYGLEDISWANNTINLSRNHIEDLEIQDQKTVDEFVEFWKQKIKQ